MNPWHAWLAKSYYGINYWTPDAKPPITIEELATAYVLVAQAEKTGDQYVTHEEWVYVLENETGAFA